MCLWDCRTTDASPEISLQCACLAPGPGRRAPPHVLFAGTSGSPLSAVDPAPASIWRCRTQRLRKLSTTADGAAPGPFGYGAADLSVGADDPADFAVAGMGLGAEAGSQMTRSCPQILNPSRYRKNGPHWAARPLSPNYVSLRKAGYFCVEQPSAYDLCGRAEMVCGDLSATPPARPTILNPAGSSAFAWRLPNPATTSYRLTCRHRSYEPGWQT